MAQWERVLDITEDWESSKEGKIPIYLLAKVIADKLKAFKISEDYDYDYLIELFETFYDDEETDVDEFDYCMEKLYDWADTRLDGTWNGKKNCWVKLY